MDIIFAINGKTYKAKEFDFNTVCDLEDMGISLETMQNKPLSMVRGYFALCTGRDKTYAGKEIEQHIINGGKMDEITEIMSQKMNDSDFFHSLKSDETESDTEIQTEETTKKK